MRKITPFCGLLLLAFEVVGQAQESAPAALPRTAAPESATTYFLSPANGATVTSPFTIRFGLRGMGVAPAGVTNPNTGHHHLLIDVAAVAAGQPADTERCQPSPLRSRPNGNGAHAPARPAHVAARARRRVTHPASAARALREDHDHRHAVALRRWTSATTSSTPSATHHSSSYGKHPSSRAARFSAKRSS